MAELDEAQSTDLEVHRRLFNNELFFVERVICNLCEFTVF
jgi:hypothetical protein